MAQCKDCIHNEICQFYKALETYVINNDCGFYKSTANVVPKSEVEYYKQLLNEECDACIGGARKKVAREIFEEIEKLISSTEYTPKTRRKTIGVEELKEQVDWVLHEGVPQLIAELKKKYTESEETE